jgi:hypothetical protein
LHYCIVPCCVLLMFFGAPLLCFVIVHQRSFFCVLLFINVHLCFLLVPIVYCWCLLMFHFCALLVFIGVLLLCSINVHWHPCGVLLMFIGTLVVICWCLLVLPCWALLVLVGAPLPHFVNVCGAPLLHFLGAPHCPLVVHQHIFVMLYWCLLAYLMCFVGVGYRPFCYVLLVFFNICCNPNIRFVTKCGMQRPMRLRECVRIWNIFTNGT